MTTNRAAGVDFTPTHGIEHGIEHGSGFRLRAAQPDDVSAIVGLIRELAEFEQLTHLLEVTPQGLAEHLFGPRVVAEAMVAELTVRDAELRDGAGLAAHVQERSSGEARQGVVGFALWFTNFSTFLGRPGLYLEDLYVQPAFRGQGLGRALLQRVAQLALQRGCGRFEWSVLDWNSRAIRLYESMGAAVLPDWRICRLTGEQLQRCAESSAQVGSR